jgi:phospholipase C
MANILDRVKTVVLLMFENRSFDHILGHLSFEKINTQIDGLHAPLSNFNNIFEGDTYDAYAIEGDTQLPFDLPHEYDEVAAQLSKSGVTGRFTMSGFVETYAKKTGSIPNVNCQPMGFFKSAQDPISSFLASRFCVCDRWFAPLPTSTQPNRNMGFFGDTNNHFTKAGLIDMENSIFDWMTTNNIRWRVYHDGLSFFILYNKQWRHVFGNNFRRYEELAYDIMNEPEDVAPQVIIIEPSYQSAPHIGSDRPNDNHAPLAIGWGEEFLRNTYRALIANLKKWESTVMITYYDEHGGFYDHVPPPNISYQTKSDQPYNFESLGVRVPAIIASPLVKPGSVCRSQFDHTSVLQFLSEKFSPGKPVSETVTRRHEQGIASITDALNNDGQLWAPPQPPTTPINVQTVLGRTIQIAPDSDVEKSFEIAANEAIQQRPEETRQKYPELFLWKEVVSKARNG